MRITRNHARSREVIGSHANCGTGGFQVFFKWSPGSAAPRLRALSRVLHRSLAGGAVEGNHLFRCLSTQAPRMLQRSVRLRLLHPALDETGG